MRFRGSLGAAAADLGFSVSVPVKGWSGAVAGYSLFGV